MQRQSEEIVSRDELRSLRQDHDELRTEHVSLSGAVFAHASAISLLIGSTARRRSEADLWSEVSFLQFVGARQDLMEPAARHAAAKTFRGFVEDAQSAHLRPAPRSSQRRRGWLRRLFG